MKEKSDIQLAIGDLARRLGIQPEQLISELNMEDAKPDDVKPDDEKAREFGRMAASLWTKEEWSR